MGGGQSIVDKHCNNHGTIHVRIISLIQFGCPFTLLNDQGVHFINDAIQTLIMHFLFKHTSSITYYP